mgnify:CR=1 FL=1
MTYKLITNEIFLVLRTIILCSYIYSIRIDEFFLQNFLIVIYIFLWNPFDTKNEVEFSDKEAKLIKLLRCSGPSTILVLLLISFFINKNALHVLHKLFNSNMIFCCIICILVLPTLIEVIILSRAKGNIKKDRLGDVQKAPE